MEAQEQLATVHFIDERRPQESERPHAHLEPEALDVYKHQLDLEIDEQLTRLIVLRGIRNGVLLEQARRCGGVS